MIGWLANELDFSGLCSEFKLWLLLQDHEVFTPTLPNQHLAYRLTGDFNNLHIDPVLARKLGFTQPILHGMCTLALATRALLRTLCDNDASRFRRVAARLVAPVLPGQTLVTQIWLDAEDPTRAVFRTVVRGPDTGTVRPGPAAEGGGANATAAETVVLASASFRGSEPLAFDGDGPAKGRLAAQRVCVRRDVAARL